MAGGLRSHLRRTYGSMIAAVLVTVVLLVGFVEYAAQINRVNTDVNEALRLYASRAQREGSIVSRSQVARIVSGTSHPEWIFSLSNVDVRYVLRWQPYVMTAQSRAAAMPRDAYPPRLIGALALLAGGRLPPHTIVNGAELTIFATPMLVRFTLWQLALTALASALMIVFAIVLADRMAYDTVRPLRVVRRALEEFAECRVWPSSLPEMGNDELGELIATYNRAIEIGNKARAERDAAEARTHQFIADAGHQLRTPLTVLSGFTGILRKGQLRHPDDGPKILEKMDQQIALMKKLVERLMLLESWQAADDAICELTDIGELVSGVVDPMAASHPERAVQLNTVVGVSACIDRAEITYAITNIVANALKYAPEGTITVDVMADRRKIYIAIADQGPGIQEDELPHIFDRFYRGSRRDVPGSGLGLAIAKIAVERAHGRLSVETHPGKGTRFTITLPRFFVDTGVQPAQPLAEAASK